VDDKKDNEERRAPLEYLPRGPRVSSYATGTGIYDWKQLDDEDLICSNPKGHCAVQPVLASTVIKPSITRCNISGN